MNRRSKIKKFEREVPDMAIEEETFHIIDIASCSVNGETPAALRKQKKPMTYKSVVKCESTEIPLS